LTSRRGLYAGLSNTAAAGLGSAASLGLTIYVGHHGGLKLLGSYAVMGTVFAVFGVVDAARSQDLTTRYAAGGGNERPRLRILLAASGLILAAGGAAAFGATTNVRGAEGALTAWVGAVIQFMTAEAVAATQIQQKFQRLAVANAVGAVAGCGAAACLLQRAGLLALGVGLLVSAVLPRLLLLSDASVRGHVRSPSPATVEVRGQTLSLTLLASAAQLVNFTDVLAIRGLSGTADVGVYRAGTQFPTLIVGLLYRGYDTVMPQLAAASESGAARLTRTAAPWLAVAVGLASGAVIGLRSQLVRVVLGHSNHDAETVLWLFATVWLVNSVVHPAALLLIARRRQGAIVRLVCIEYAANLLLTVALVPAFGAVGSAVATLVTLTLSNLVLLPRILGANLTDLPIARHLVVDCLLPSVLAAGVAFAGFALVTS
jgi:O-antigen/teichoic acid export membrane protein